MIDSGIYGNLTPQVPFRRISRSLLVTGGRPSPQRLTSNEGLPYSSATKPPQVRQLSVRESHLYSRTSEGKSLHPRIYESRQLRVERKALVFFPTLNKRLSRYQRTILAASRPTRASTVREFSRAPRLPLHLSVCDFCRGMSIYMRAIFRRCRQSAPSGLQTSQIIARSRAKPRAVLRSYAKSRHVSVSPAQSLRYRA